ncbi:SHSP domain-containing protein [Mycena venus]|uniref:SHSP domain-containing protein n=1 Tax=Mycena venus TaxID=2733690 RepID=A0A8H6YU49_9AGAR|nr:SHSP domain-containing protein [Mycena venus]
MRFPRLSASSYELSTRFLQLADSKIQRLSGTENVRATSTILACSSSTTPMSYSFYYEPFADLERLVNEAFRTRGAANGDNNQVGQLQGQLEGDGMTFRPKMDLHENAENNTVTATFELPGIKKEDVQIETLPGRLRVSAECKMSEKHEKDGYAIRERRYGKYARTLQLPQGVKANEIKANMENGVLTVTFPKSTPELAPKKIQVA